MRVRRFKLALGFLSWPSKSGAAPLVGFLLSMAVLCPCFAQSPIAPSKSETIVERFRLLNRATIWRKTEEIKLQFKTSHPQGMTLVGDRIFLSSVEVLDRAAGVGKGHLFEIDFQGRPLRHRLIGEGSVYHPGGIDFDGEFIWVPVAEYKPESRSIVYRVDPSTLAAQKVFAFNDHLGAIVRDKNTDSLLGVNWGSRHFYRWKLLNDEPYPRDPDAPERFLNGSHYIDYQDAQSLSGTGFVLFSGLNHYPIPGMENEKHGFGGIELIRLESLKAEAQIPVPLWTPDKIPMTRNPFFIQPREKGLQFFFIPEDENSVLYIYTAGARPQESPPR